MSSSSSDQFVWSLKDKSPLLEVALGTRVKYAALADSEREAGSVRTTNPIKKGCGVFYFEVTILKTTAAGGVSVGFCAKSCSMTRLPGNESNSFGYHGDDGKVYKGSISGTAYGKPFIERDIIGCCIDFSRMAIFFTHNGNFLDFAFEDITSDPDRELEALYPCIGMRCANEEIDTNFGSKPFHFDLDSYIQEAKIRNFDKIVHRKRSEPDSSTNQARTETFNQIILSYLTHHGCVETAKQFAQDSHQKIQEAEHSISARRDISNLIHQGHVDTAIRTINQYYPDVIESNPSIQFKLECLKFIEIIRNKHDDKLLLTLGMQLQQMGSQEKFASSANSQLLKSVVGLLAYPDPTSCPLSHLLDDRFRTEIALEVNRAILQSLGLQPDSTLDTMAVEINAGLDHLQQRQDPNAAMIDITQLFPAS